MNLGLEQDCGRGENEKKGREECKCGMVWQGVKWELRKMVAKREYECINTKPLKQSCFAQQSYFKFILKLHRLAPNLLQQRRWGHRSSQPHQVPRFTLPWTDASSCRGPMLADAGRHWQTLASSHKVPSSDARLLKHPNYDSQEMCLGGEMELIMHFLFA